MYFFGKIKEWIFLKSKTILLFFTFLRNAKAIFRLKNPVLDFPKEMHPKLFNCSKSPHGVYCTSLWYIQASIDEHLSETFLKWNLSYKVRVYGRFDCIDL